MQHSVDVDQQPDGQRRLSCSSHKDTDSSEEDTGPVDVDQQPAASKMRLSSALMATLQHARVAPKAKATSKRSTLSSREMIPKQLQIAALLQHLVIKHPARDDPTATAMDDDEGASQMSSDDDGAGSESSDIFHVSVDPEKHGRRCKTERRSKLKL